MIFRRSKRIRRNNEIAPDEIFLDSSNLPQFDTDQFEGQIEKPISKRSLIFTGIFFVLVASFFMFKIGSLQIAEGSKYKDISENNRLHHSFIFAERGAITDRTGKIVAWNSIDPNQAEYSLRGYTPDPGAYNLLGYVKYPKKDKFGFYYNTEYDGADGVEKYFQSILSGEHGLKITETDALGHALSESTVRPPQKGENIELSIDMGSQTALYKAVEEMARRSGYVGGAAVVMDVHTGEILSSVSYPEYDSNVLTSGQDGEKIKSYLTNSNNPFLDRVASGLYAPGSIVKPLWALAALAEDIITPEKQIESTGELKVPNPYRPGEFTVFKDWKAHGYTDMREAIAVSSDVYFYQIGGGFPGQKGLGIDLIDKYAKLFGFGTPLPNNFFSGKKGVIPTPEWKKENFDGDIWRVGDTYNTSIGQYGFQITPIQALRSVAAIANDGVLLTPTLLSEKSQKQLEAKGLVPRITHERITFPKTISHDDYQVIKEGMRMTVTEGTMGLLNVPYAKVAGKSGTAQVGISKKSLNSWSVGFFPYDNPKYAFAVLLEKGPNVEGVVSASAAVRQWLDWMSIYAPHYLQ